MEQHLKLFTANVTDINVNFHRKFSLM